MPTVELWPPDRIVIASAFSENERVKEVPGAKWEDEYRTWYTSLSWASCIALRGVFGDDLTVGDALNDWAATEALRAQRCLALRDAEDCEPEARETMHRADDLEPRQRAGVQFLVEAERALMGDGCGAGKTVQSICAVETLAAKGHDPFPCLIICTNSMVLRWVDELNTWAPGRSAVAIRGSAAKRRKIIAEPSDYYVLNWEGLRAHTRLAGFGNIALSDKDKEPKELNTLAPRTVIADEAHRARIPKTAQTRAWWWMSRHATYAIANTGTPVERGPEDLWSIMSGVCQQEWPSKTAWIDRYCVPPESLVWMPDLTFQAIGDIRVGDEVLGFSKAPLVGQGAHPHYEATRVTAVNRHEAELVRVSVQSGDSFLCTPDHRWLAGWGRFAKASPRVMFFTEPAVGYPLKKVIHLPSELTSAQQKWAHWLGGLYDGEGTGLFLSQSQKANPDVHAQIGKALGMLEFEYRETPLGYHIQGGRSAYAKFVHWCRPVKRHAISAGQRLDEHRKFRGALSMSGHGRNGFATEEIIASVEPAGRGEVVSLTTDTQTYVVHGYASHNCLQSWNEFGGRSISGLRPDNRDELFRYLDPRFIRRPTQVVVPNIAGKLPADVRRLELPPKQRKAYDQLRKHMLAQLDDGILVAASPLAQMTRLRQFASAYAQVDPEGAVTLAEPSCKLDALDDYMDELAGDQLVVFASHRQLIELAAARLAKQQIPFGLVTGAIGTAQRAQSVADFQNGDLRVILLTIASGGEGLTLTATPHVAFIERSWSHTENLQAEDRVWRRGQTRTVQPVIFQSDSTIEQRVDELGLIKAGHMEEACRDEATLRKMLT